MDARSAVPDTVDGREDRLDAAVGRGIVTEGAVYADKGEELPLEPGDVVAPLAGGEMFEVVAVREGPVFPSVTLRPFAAFSVACPLGILHGYGVMSRAADRVGGLREEA